MEGGVGLQFFLMDVPSGGLEVGIHRDSEEAHFGDGEGKGKDGSKASRRREYLEWHGELQ
jgi:hypothetical protein